MEDTLSTRKRRKEEGRRVKKQRIEESGGVRPRKKPDPAARDGELSNKPSSPAAARGGKNRTKQQRGGKYHHRFGRVMDKTPCRNKPRRSTLSIAIPGSVVSNCQTRELKTLLVGQIARAATIYHVDEIIVFDDKLSREQRHGRSFYGSRNRHGNKHNNRDEKNGSEGQKTEPQNEETHGDRADQQHNHPRPSSDPHEFMARLLQYCECPQYLRRHFFPMHPDLQFSGLLAPIDAPHHVRAEDRCKYREGVVLAKKNASSSEDAETGFSLVNCGIRNRPVEIDARLTPGIRCTVQLDPASYGKSGQIKGKVVSPSAPREDNGTYWGYTTRLASSIKQAIDECPFEGGYDLKIGTSERGDKNIEQKEYSIPRFKHSLIVFGGVAGIEECVDADEHIKLPGSESRKLFDDWVNICPYQGSRTIRTEEAVLITLAKYSPLLADAGDDTNRQEEKSKTAGNDQAPAVEFSDDDPSDESSENDED